MRSLVPALALVLALAGCGTSDDRDRASAVVGRFYDAIAADRPAEACAQLGDAALEQLESQTGKPCREGIASLDLTPGAVVAARVFITNAKVDVDSGESAFLDRDATGWKLSAIGCKPEKGKPRDRPLECEVEA